MNVLRSAPALTWPKAVLFIVGAVLCFHLAYLKTAFGPLHLAIFGYLICLVQLARLQTVRRSFYAGLLTALLCVAPQLFFFWRIFGPAAIALWLILALWIAAFTGLANATLKRFGPLWTVALIPFVWTGLEYFRSELYYLKFSWMNVGYAFSSWQLVPYQTFGMYGVGFIVALSAALFLVIRARYVIPGIAALLAIIYFAFAPILTSERYRPIHIAGVQMEFPSEREIPPALDALLAKYPNADLFVLSEYTLDGPVPESLKNWCRTHQHFVVVGGKDPAPNNNYYDSVFVIGPEGSVFFRQGKSVPIQFFKDGLPAPEQKVWDSPWGTIGFCVCYDLSYTRVVDGLIRKGAQIIIVPTMDLMDWGEHQHELHALVAPVRAAEYNVPIFRLASSGISQAVDLGGNEVATAPFDGQGKSLYATLDMPENGGMPLDRYLAPFATRITGILVIALFLLRFKKTPATLEYTGEPSPRIAHTNDLSQK